VAESALRWRKGLNLGGLEDLPVAWCAARHYSGGRPGVEEPAPRNGHAWSAPPPVDAVLGSRAPDRPKV
jgi:hypothetical protein